MELNLEQIKAAAMAVGGAESGTWQALRYTVMLPDGDCILTAYDSMGAMPEPIHGDDVAAFIAAANPATVLALIERLERAERERDQALEEAAMKCEEQCAGEYSPEYNSAADDCARAIRAMKGK